MDRVRWGKRPPPCYSLVYLSRLIKVSAPFVGRVLPVEVSRVSGQHMFFSSGHISWKFSTLLVISWARAFFRSIYIVATYGGFEDLEYLALQFRH